MQRVLCPGGASAGHQSVSTPFPPAPGFLRAPGCDRDCQLRRPRLDVLLRVAPQPLARSEAVPGSTTEVLSATQEWTQGPGRAPEQLVVEH